MDTATTLGARRLLATGLMALLLAAALGALAPAAAHAAQTALDVSKGPISIGNGTVSGTAPNGDPVTSHNPEGYTISGSTTTNTVSVTGGAHAITLDGASIDVSAHVPTLCAFGIGGGGGRTNPPQ